MQVLQSSHYNNQVDGREQFFKTLYMIGDNPAVDIKGARQVCSQTYYAITVSYFILCLTLNLTF